MKLLAFAGSFVAGIILSSAHEAPASALVLFLVAAIALGVLLHTSRLSIRLPLVLLLPFLVLGMLRAAGTGADSDALASFHGRTPHQVEGVVVSDPEPAGEFTRLRLRVDRVGLNGEWSTASGDVLVTLREPVELVRVRERPYFRYGDRLLLAGVLKAPRELEDFDYPAYLARQGIGTVMGFPTVELLDEGEGSAFYRWLYGVRHSLADSISVAVPRPQDSVGQALLLGIRDNLPDALVEDFRATGSSHILAISGLHVGILLALSLSLNQWLLGRRRHLYLLAPFALIWMYTLLSGMSPSAARAAIMGTAYLVALLTGRPRSVLPALGLAAAVMVAISPDVLWSVSFQLSFAAMVGITTLSVPLSRSIQAMLGFGYDGRPSLLSTVADASAMTVAATFATLPLIAFYFGRVSLVGLPTTLLLTPAMPFALVAHAVAAFAGLVSASSGQVVGWFAWVLTSYLTGVTQLMARVPGASVDAGRISGLLVSSYYGVFVAIYLVRNTRVVGYLKKRLPMRPPGVRSVNVSVPWYALVLLVSVASLVWIAALTRTDTRLHVYFADVGQGDGVLIVTPGGRQVLIDGGPDPLKFAQFISEKMPSNDRTIELMVLTHPHGDHVNGLIEVLRGYDVEMVLERAVAYDSAPYVAWRQAVDSEGANVVQAQAGQVVELDSGVLMQVVSPPRRLLSGTASDVDNASVAVRLVYGDVSFLFTGDMFSEAEGRLVREGIALDSDVLKVGHHGSRTSSTKAFLDRVRPAVAVISAGEGNRFGHPHSKAVESLLEHVPETNIFLTSERGAIELVTDGKVLDVVTQY
ncbi:MAG: DNA internalization-related competence protein ComEC/Rec2 [Chloroflexi bacterium]|nr:DNA internalization-related competence protein ComEC/Rec2 [Chloroflexota bacterium]